MFRDNEVSAYNDEQFIASMVRINDKTDAEIDEGIDYTISNGELIFTKNWIRYVIVDHLKHPAKDLEDDEYEPM